MTAGFRPLADRMLIRPTELPDRTRAGLHLPSMVRKKLADLDGARGIVLALGPGMLMSNGQRWPMPPVDVGQTVIFQIEGAQKVQIDGEELLSVREDFVLAVDEG
jgi:chaperonin GroES